jgi:carbonic anhydrase/acetyltransferase-like protein (isoleucine patch superfamily)
MGNAFNIQDNVGVGYKTLSQVRNQGNTAMGTYAGQKLANSIWNTAIGYHALETDTTGSENTVIGTSAFRNNANGIRNVSLGINTGFWAIGNNNSYIGSYAGEGWTGFSTGNSNTAVGDYALRNVRSASQNVAVGESALGADSTGNLNVAVGAGAMDQRLRGNDNVAVGFWAGRGDTAGTASVYIGRDAGYNNSRDYTVAVGYQALYNNGLGLGAVTLDSATGNTAVGTQALLLNTKGKQNTSVGYLSSVGGTTANFNTALGYGALNNPNTSFNTAIGDLVLAFATGANNTGVGSNMMQGLTGSNNVGMGPNTLFNATSADNNVSIGLQSMFNTSTGDDNTAIGHQAMITNTIGDHNTSLGYLSNVSANNLVNASAIGANSFVAQSNSMVLGSINGVNGATVDSKVGIGTTTPDSTFSVADNFMVNKSGEIQYSNPAKNMMYMFQSGAANADRMVVAHSPAFPTWGLQYQDATDQFNFIGGGVNRMVIELGTGQVGLGMVPTTQLELSLNSAQKPTSAFWTITSDERLKTIDGNYTKGLKEILKLNTIMYHYAKGNARNLPVNEQGYGFSAQEVQKIFPEAVKVGEDGYLGLDLHPVFVSYINAIKEQQQIIDKQQKTIDDLLIRVQKLEQK